MALKLFYNYAKDNKVYRLKKRRLIENELQKLYYAVKETLNLHSQLVQSARREVVNDIVSWIAVGDKFNPLRRVKLERIYPMRVDLGLRSSAVVTGSKPTFVKHRRLLYKVSYYWRQIDKLKSKLPKNQRTSKQIKHLWGR